MTTRSRLQPKRRLAALIPFLILGLACGDGGGTSAAGSGGGAGSAGNGGAGGRAGAGGRGGEGGNAACETDAAGAGAAYDNMQPSLGLRYIISATGVLPQDDPSSTDLVLGQLNLFAGNFTPSGWLSAEGQLLAVVDYPDLFVAMGVTHGGDGINTFALPDLRGRAALIQGRGDGLSERPMGWTGGAEVRTQSEDQLPSHTHTFASVSGATEPSGGSSPTPAMQPSLAIQAGVIREGVFPTRDGGLVNGRFLGRIHMSVGALLPDDTFPADGALLPIAQNSALFSIMGIQYGGDGRTEFGVPPLSGRVIVSAGQGPGLTQRASGWLGGEEAVSLTEAQMAPHSHALEGGLLTEASGGGQPYSVLQPSTALRYIIRLTGTFPSPSGGPVRDFLGEVAIFTGAFAPSGWAFAEGQLLSIATHSALFSLLGTQFGGDGRNDFALPDLRGRTPVHVGQGPGLSDRSVGWQGGSEQVTLNESQLAPHAHEVSAPTSADVCSASFGAQPSSPFR